MKCPIVQCESPSCGKVTWGHYAQYKLGRPHHVAWLCEKHLMELWEKSKSQVVIGTMHFVIEQS